MENNERSQCTNIYLFEARLSLSLSLCAAIENNFAWVDHQNDFHVFGFRRRRSPFAVLNARGANVRGVAVVAHSWFVNDKNTFFIGRNLQLNKQIINSDPL